MDRSIFSPNTLSFHFDDAFPDVQAVGSIGNNTLIPSEMQAFELSADNKTHSSAP